ncbi:MAG: hypothetical protein ACYSSI_05050 [Planctomycetota bacterium]|jgi:hypothetical protein
MRKFGKGYNLALMFALIGVFLCQNPAYSSDTSLRVPFSCQDKNFNVKFEKVASEESSILTEEELRIIVAALRKFSNNDPRFYYDDREKIRIKRLNRIFLNATRKVISDLSLDEGALVIEIGSTAKLTHLVDISDFDMGIICSASMGGISPLSPETVSQIRDYLTSINLSDLSVEESGLFTSRIAQIRPLLVESLHDALSAEFGEDIEVELEEGPLLRVEDGEPTFVYQKMRVRLLHSEKVLTLDLNFYPANFITPTSTYHEGCLDQFRQIKEKYDDSKLEEVLAHIRFAKYLFQYLDLYLGVGGLRGALVEQLILQSGRYSDKGKTIIEPGNFYRAMGLLCRVGFNPDGSLKKIEEVKKDLIIYNIRPYISSGENLLDLVNQEIWEKLAYAAKYISELDSKIDRRDIIFQASYEKNTPAPEPPTFEEAIRIAKESSLPVSEITTLFDLIGRENVIKGLRAQGEEKFKETLSLFYKVGIGKCIKYIAILNDEKMIGQAHISRDFARGPYSIARTLEFIDNREIEIEDLRTIIPRLKNAIGERSFERAFPPFSLYYFFVTVKKVKTIGVDDSVSIISMLKDLIGQEYVGEAYEQGHLWFVEALEIFSHIGISKSEILIEDFRSRANSHYFNIAFAHNPRSFARYMKLKSESPDKEINFIIAGKEITGGEIITLLHDLSEKYFDEGSYLYLAPSEFIAFVFDAVRKHLEGEKYEKIAIFLKNKYFSGLAKRRVYSLLKAIGPEIEVQRDLETYDVETAHMIAFFLLVETSGDGLIEFPLGPARYHGSLSAIVRAMGEVSIGEEFLIPRDRVIPLDVSISVPAQLIYRNEFQEKATLLRIVNDLLYTAKGRLATAFQRNPVDQSGILFKEGRAKVINSKGLDLDIVENRTSNLITDAREVSIAEPLTAHEASFEFYQLMYSALVASLMKESERDEFEDKLADLYRDFEKEVLGILEAEEVKYITSITSNEKLALLILSHVRTSNPNINTRLHGVVQRHLALINQEVVKEGLRRRIAQLGGDKRDVEQEIKDEIEIQKDIDVEYGKALEGAFQELESDMMTEFYRHNKLVVHRQQWMDI